MSSCIPNIEVAVQESLTTFYKAWTPWTKASALEKLVTIASLLKQMQGSNVDDSLELSIKTIYTEIAKGLESPKLSLTYLKLFPEIYTNLCELQKLPKSFPKATNSTSFPAETSLIETIQAIARKTLFQPITTIETKNIQLILQKIQSPEKLNPTAFAQQIDVALSILHTIKEPGLFSSSSEEKKRLRKAAKEFLKAATQEDTLSSAGIFLHQGKR